MKSKFTLRKVGVIALITFSLVATLGLMGCGGGNASANISDENKANAKTVLKAASNVFAITENLDLTEADSPATISTDDPRFDEFFAELKKYQTMEGVELESCSFTVAIQSVTAATAREDSTQTNYRYTINSADMKVNDSEVSYNSKDGFSSK